MLPQSKMIHVEEKYIRITLDYKLYLLGECILQNKDHEQTFHLERLVTIKTIAREQQAE